MNNQTIIIILSIICIFLITVVSLIKHKINKYFRSFKFIELSRLSDDVSALHENINKEINRLNKSIYADFAPSVQEQIILQNYAGDACTKNDTLPPHTYLCDSEIFKKYENNHYGFMEKYLSVHKTRSMIEYLTSIQASIQSIEFKRQQFLDEYEQTLSLINERLPIMIKIFAKKRAMFLLGFSNNLKNTQFASLTFIDKNNNNKKIQIIFNEIELTRLIQFLSIEIPKETTTNSVRLRFD